MAAPLTNWFVFSSPTGSNQNAFFSSTGIGDQIGDAEDLWLNLSTPIGGGIILDWGSAGAYPTNSIFSPTVFVRNLANNPYTQSWFNYTDANTSGPVISTQQNFQLSHFPGIVTGSYGGVFASSASAASVAGNGEIALTSPFAPLDYDGVVSMSFYTTDIAGINRTAMLNNVLVGDKFVLRNFTSNVNATYTVLSKDTNLGVGIIGFSVSHESGDTGSPDLQDSLGIDFIKLNQNQKTFYLVGAANPRGDQLYANQFTTGSTGGSGDYRCGIIKIFATESNNTSDWTSLIRTVTGDNSATWDPLSLGPSYVAANHNLFMFTASAGNSGSYELLVDLA